MKNEFLLLRSQLEHINGQPILSSKTGVTLDSILEQVSNTSNQVITHSAVRASLPEPRSGLIPPCPKKMGVKVFASDSSDSTEFAYNIEQPGQVFSSNMTLEETGLSSGHRELKSVLNCVLNHPEFFAATKPSKVYWLVDSQNLFSWLKKGSKKMDVQKDVFQLFLRLGHLNVYLEPILVPRDHEAIALADFAGKFKNTDGWSIDDVSFQALQLISGSLFTCDVFAHSSNSRCRKFYSLVPSFGTSGINAFSMSWEADNNFVCPPMKEIVYVIRHILANPCKGVLVVPHLPGARFWHSLVAEDRNFLSIFKKSHIFCPDLYPGFGCSTSSFSGPFYQHNKKFIGLVFDSN